MRTYRYFQKTDLKRKMKTGFSATTLFLGIFSTIARKDWTFTFLLFAGDILFGYIGLHTGGIGFAALPVFNLLVAFVANDHASERLEKQGYLEISKEAYETAQHYVAPPVEEHKEETPVQTPPTHPEGEVPKQKPQAPPLVTKQPVCIEESRTEEDIKASADPALWVAITLFIHLHQGNPGIASVLCKATVPSGYHFCKGFGKSGSTYMDAIGSGTRLTITNAQGMVKWQETTLKETHLMDLSVSFPVQTNEKLTFTIERLEAESFCELENLRLYLTK